MERLSGGRAAARVVKRRLYERRELVLAPRHWSLDSFLAKS